MTCPHRSPWTAYSGLSGTINVPTGQYLAFVIVPVLGDLIPSATAPLATGTLVLGPTDKTFTITSKSIFYYRLFSAQALDDDTPPENPGQVHLDAVIAKDEAVEAAAMRLYVNGTYKQTIFEVFVENLTESGRDPLEVAPWLWSYGQPILASAGV